MTNPRREAFDRVRGRYDVRVLEPSPPAVSDPAYSADDPVAVEPRAPGLELLSPVGNGDVTWDELARRDGDLREWCADRWLGAWRRLPALPSAADALASTRASLHTLAEQVIAPARRRATGKIGLRFTRGGFGTPFFGDGGGGVQVRVDGLDLVVVGRAGAERREPITTVRAAAQLVGIEPGAPADLYQPATEADPDARLMVDPAAAHLLADWFGFAWSVLEELRVETGARGSRTQLWPEHFDASVDVGDEATGTRGTFGASPGDSAHAEPYLYVTHWNEPVPRDPFWNDPAFAGASLPYAALSTVDDQRTTALEFFRTGVHVLGGRHG
jgi:hypothetical protein